MCPGGSTEQAAACSEPQQRCKYPAHLLSKVHEEGICMHRFLHQLWVGPTNTETQWEDTEYLV